MINWNEKANFCDSDETLEEYFNRRCDFTVGRMYHRQTDWLYMAGEKGKNPVLKGWDEFSKAFDEAWDYANGYLMEECAKAAYLMQLKESDVDLDEETAWMLSDWLGEDAYE